MSRSLSPPGCTAQPSIRRSRRRDSRENSAFAGKTAGAIGRFAGRAI